VGVGVLEVKRLKVFSMVVYLEFIRSMFYSCVSPFYLIFLFMGWFLVVKMIMFII